MAGMTIATLLVGGLHGSGKSLLWNLCQTHPQIVLTEEFYNFLKLDVSYAEHVPIVRDRLRSDRAPILIDKGKVFLKRQRLANIAFLARYWLGLQPFRYKVITSEVVQDVLHRIFPKATVVGDVGPNYHVDRLVHIRPSLPVVMYRDCRDVAAQIAWKFRRQLRRPNVPEWLQKRDSAEKVARLWVQSTELMEQHAGSVYRIRYEDLAADPQKTLAAFGERIGIDPYRFQSRIAQANKIGMYKQHLSSKEVGEIIEVAGPIMERLGYL